MSFLTTNPNRHLVTVPSLNGVVTSANGNAATDNLSNVVTSYINTDTNAASFNTIQSYTRGNPVTFTNNLNLSNTSILYNGTPLLTSNTLNTRVYTAFQVNNAEKARLTSNGLGIGISNPLASLDVSGTTILRGNIGIGLLNPLEYASLDVSGITLLRGNVGIGTLAPSASLEVLGTTVLNGGVDVIGGISLTNGNADITGNMGINGNMIMNGDMNINGNIRTDGSFYCDGPNITYGSVYISSFGVPLNSTVGNLYADGDLFATGIKYPSDPALKANIIPYELHRALPEPVEFTWKSNGQRDIGVLASDVADIEPVCVHTNANGMRSVDYPKLVVLCLAELKRLKEHVGRQDQAIQELQAAMRQSP
jgi:hypothetical protein